MCHTEAAGSGLLLIQVLLTEGSTRVFLLAGREKMYRITNACCAVKGGI